MRSHPSLPGVFQERDFCEQPWPVAPAVCRQSNAPAYFCASCSLCHLSLQGTALPLLSRQELFGASNHVERFVGARLVPGHVVSLANCGCQSRGARGCWPPGPLLRPSSFPLGADLVLQGLLFLPANSRGALITEQTGKCRSYYYLYVWWGNIVNNLTHPHPLQI